MKSLDPILALTNEQVLEYELTKAQPPLCLPCDDKGTLKEFFPYKVQSVYVSKKLGKMFHLHPEFVLNQENNEDECVVLCQSCKHQCIPKSGSTKSPMIPKHSIAAGIDFGDYKRVGLEEPSLAERIVIAKTRHYHNVIKINNNQKVGSYTDFTKSKLQGHSILFHHDAPIIASLALLLESYKKDGLGNEGERLGQQLSQFLSIYLLGSKGKKDPIARNSIMSKQLKVWPHVIYQWISILQQTSEQYKGSDPPLPSFSEVAPLLQQAHEVIFSKAKHIADQSIVNAENKLRDDIAQV